MVTWQPLENFPQELVYLIFTYGCIVSTPFCITLSQTSLWTRQLALPYLYSTVIIKRLATITAFSNALSQSPIHPLTTSLTSTDNLFFDPRRFVRNIWVSAVSNHILDIYKKCDAVENLALHHDNFLWLVYASTQSNYRIEQLSHRSILRKPNFRLTLFGVKDPEWSLTRFVRAEEGLTSPLFARITHLRLDAMHDYENYLRIAHFKGLSYLALPFYNSAKQNLDLLKQVFVPFPGLQMLVVVVLEQQLIDYAGRWVFGERHQGSRVFLCPSDAENYQAEWEEEVRGGLDIWQKAEKFTYAFRNS